MLNKLKVTGIVRVYEFYPGHCPKRPVSNIEQWVQSRSCRKVVETSNLVTDIGLGMLAAMIAGGLGVHTINGSGYGESNYTTLRIVNMQLTDAGAPAAPAAGDQTLSQPADYEFFTDYPTQGDQLLSSVQLGTIGQVRFSGLVNPQDAVGTTFTEEGLFAESGELFARTTFSYTKTNNVAVQFDHDISISRV